MGEVKEGPMNMKLLLLGDSGVGKSTILLRLTSDPKFFLPRTLVSTIGIASCSKTFALDSQQIKAQIVGR
jgi:GTPase SAR1 family protein